MTRVTGVRSVELGVRDIHESVKFYSEMWGLEVASTERETVHMRGTGSEHHLVSLRQTGQPTLLGVHFAAGDRAAVDALHGSAKGYGVKVNGEAALLPKEAGGGYGFRFKSPDGLPLCVSCEVTRHDNVVTDRSKPTKVSHVVLNSAATDEQVPFFIDALGFKLSDSSHMMEFLRCSSDHHAIAVFRNKGPSLNHVAFEMPNIDGLMLGVGRLKSNGIDPEWGIGRHGPGNNVFSYFVEPNGFVTEYTTEVSQIDESIHVPQDPAYWDRMAPTTNNWGDAGRPGNRMRAAMSGALYIGDGERCEDLIARKLG